MILYIKFSSVVDMDMFQLGTHTFEPLNQSHLIKSKPSKGQGQINISMGIKKIPYFP